MSVNYAQNDSATRRRVSRVGLLFSLRGNVSETWAPLEFSPEGKCDRADEKQKGNRVVPFNVLAEVQPRKDDEYAERDYLLNPF